jgi:hypothetical protein
MRTTCREDVPLQSVQHFLLVTALAVLGFWMLVRVEEAASTPDLQPAMSEAAAGLLAAILAVLVSHLSHRQGRARRALKRQHGEAAFGARTVGVVLLITSVALAVFAYFAARELDISKAAALTLAAAVLSYTLADFLHDVYSKARTCDSCGWVLILVAILIAAIGILVYPANAGWVAAIAAPVVTFGGSLLGHAEGFST